MRIIQQLNYIYESRIDRPSGTDFKKLAIPLPEYSKDRCPYCGENMLGKSEIMQLLLCV